nr:AraC family transcriptional regulator [Fodinibius sediminis]
MNCEIGTDGSWTHSSMVPPGCAKLSITLNKDNIRVKENSREETKYEPITFVGQTTQYKNLAWRDRLHLFLVVFEPFGAFPLLGISQDCCQNQCIGFSALVGSSESFLEEHLAEKQETDDVRECVDRFFLKRIKRLTKRDEIKKLSHAIEKIKRCHRSRSSVKALCRETGYSLSTFERHMKKIVGVRPKEFQRIMRFNLCLDYISQQPKPLNWSRVAHRFGYYDQTHFIKEFKLFYGKTPAQHTSEDNHLLSDVAHRDKQPIDETV